MSVEDPQLFANRVIREMVDHLFSESFPVDEEDFTVIRNAFKYNKGSWEKLDEGDTVQYDRLLKLVTIWGQMADRLMSETKSKVV